jgi:outer membrane biosynthesis protein TonB
MAKYSEKEIRAFRLKDQFQARMSALKAASMNNEGKGKKSATILKEADEYLTWLQEGQDPVPDAVEEKDDEPEKEEPTTKPESDSDVLPKPATADENKVLKAIFKETGADSQSEKEAVARKVLGWAKDVHGVSRYPSMDNSVDEVVKYISK